MLAVIQIREQLQKKTGENQKHNCSWQISRPSSLPEEQFVARRGGDELRLTRRTLTHVCVSTVGCRPGVAHTATGLL